MNESRCKIISYDSYEESSLHKQLKAEMTVSELYNSGHISLSEARKLYGYIELSTNQKGD